MKTSKKVLGVVLTLIMLVNVFAVSVFAAYPDDAAIALIIKTDKSSYLAGEEVTITVSAKALTDVGSLRIGGQHELGYTSAGLELYTADKTDALKTNQAFVPGDAFATSYNDAYSQIVLGGTPTDGKGWDNVLTFALIDDGSTGAACADAEAVLFTYKMKVPAGAADGTYSIGFNRVGYEDNWTAYATTADGMDLYSNDGSAYGKTYLYDFGVATFTVGEGGGSSGDDTTTPVVNNIDAQVKWADKEANLINVGFRGQIASGYDASTDKTGTEGPNGGDNLSTLTEVGFYINNSKVPAYTIYDFVGGGYFYRAVVANVDYQNTDTLSAKAYVVINGTEYTAAEAFTTSAKAEYDEVKTSMEA